MADGYDCCDHCEHPPRHLAAESDWQLWHIRPCESGCNDE